MIRKIIHIDEEKCNGCGLCAEACHEGAIEMVNGKAKLVRENFCDGFGDCLPGCPTGAITFEEREAPEYEEHVKKCTDQLEDEDRKNATNLLESLWNRVVGKEDGRGETRTRRLSRLEDDAVRAECRRSACDHRQACLPPRSVALPDKACSDEGSVLRRRKAPDRCGLHGLCLRQHA